MQDFKILSYEEENSLSIEDKKKYYIELKDYLTLAKYSQFNDLHLELAKKLNKKVTRDIIDKIKGYKLIIDGKENIPSGPCIYASTHQDYNDHFNIVLAIPEHAIILNTINVTLFFKTLMWFNGIVYVDRNDSQSRFNAKIELMKCLAKGKSIVVFPEGTWLCSPDKLHLPLHKGIIDMARKMEVPVVPLIQEYTYKDIFDGKNHVKSCHVRFGKPIYIDINDNTDLKLEELSEAFSTIRYDLISEKGKYTKDNISIQEYIQYVLSRINDWKKTKVDINEERKTIYGANDDFYLFHHINDIPISPYGILMDTEETQKLELINYNHLQR